MYNRPTQLRRSFQCKFLVNALFAHEPLLATAFSWPSVRRRPTILF
jgi:hypothetical protein